MQFYGARTLRKLVTSNEYHALGEDFEDKANVAL